MRFARRSRDVPSVRSAANGLESAPVPVAWPTKSRRPLSTRSSRRFRLQRWHHRSATSGCSAGLANMLTDQTGKALPTARRLTAATVPRFARIRPALPEPR